MDSTHSSGHFLWGEGIVEEGAIIGTVSQGGERTVDLAKDGSRGYPKRAVYLGWVWLWSRGADQPAASPGVQERWRGKNWTCGTGCCIPQAIGLSVGCVSNYVREGTHPVQTCVWCFPFKCARRRRLVRYAEVVQNLSQREAASAKTNSTYKYLQNFYTLLC